MVKRIKDFSTYLMEYIIPIILSANKYLSRYLAGTTKDWKPLFTEVDPQITKVDSAATLEATAKVHHKTRNERNILKLYEECLAESSKMLNGMREHVEMLNHFTIQRKGLLKGITIYKYKQFRLISSVLLYECFFFY